MNKMEIKSEIFLDTLIGTKYEKNGYYCEIYDINENVIKKELINEIMDPKDEVNNLKLIKDINLEAFCFDCKRNINFSMTPNCKNHNFKYLSDLSKDINIEIIENNFKNAIENYEIILKYMEKKIKYFKIRNENQILLVKKMIEAYKTNINNLNYQIILNAKNVLNFNNIDLKSLTQNESLINLDFNILKEFSSYNYVNESISIEKIQKNLEIKFNDSGPINCVILLENRNKLIFNIDKKIFLFNTNNCKIEHQIESSSKIILLNLMEDKETILISHKDNIEKLKIENGKLILQEFLSKVNIYRPGIIINYKNEFAWTNGFNIGFIDKDYNIMESYESKKMACLDYSGGFKGHIVKLFQYKDDILFIFDFIGFNHHMESYRSIKFGSYKKKLNYSQFLTLEIFGFDVSLQINVQSDYKMYHFENEQMIIFGIRFIIIVDIYKWKKIKSFMIEDLLIQNSFYLNNSLFLLFFGDKQQKISKYLDEILVSDGNEELPENGKKNIISIMKIYKNCEQILFKHKTNFELSKIYYNLNVSSNKYGLNKDMIVVSGNIMEFYRFINIKKLIKMKNNN